VTQTVRHRTSGKAATATTSRRGMRARCLRPLQEYLPKMPKDARVLIPGCGSAYEAGYLAENGFRRSGDRLQPCGRGAGEENLARLGEIARLADFFDFDYGSPYDVIYERAFLCALPPTIWPQYAPRTAQLLRPGGKLVGFFSSRKPKRGRHSALRQRRCTRCSTPA